MIFHNHKISEPAVSINLISFSKFVELQYVSPKLLACKDLELAVPGSYTPGQELIRISSIHQNLQVYMSYHAQSFR